MDAVSLADTVPFLSGIVALFFLLLALGEFDTPCLSIADFFELTEHPERFFQQTEAEAPASKDTSTAQFFSFCLLCTGFILFRYRAYQKVVQQENAKIKEAFQCHSARYARLLMITIVWQLYLLTACQMGRESFLFSMRIMIMHTNIVLIALIMGHGRAMTSKHVYQPLQGEGNDSLSLADWWGYGAEANLCITEVATCAYIWPLRVDTSLSWAFILVKPLAVVNLVVLYFFVRKARERLLLPAAGNPQQQAIRNLFNSFIVLLMLLTVSTLWFSLLMEALTLLSLMACVSFCSLVLTQPILRGEW